MYIFSSDSPVLWIRIDPEVNLIRRVSFKQSDFMWHFQLRHERDVIAQAEVSICNSNFTKYYEYKNNNDRRLSHSTQNTEKQVSVPVSFQFDALDRLQIPQFCFTHST